MSVKGYKIFNSEWTCNGKTYKPGETASQGGDLLLYGNGIHFCKDLYDCFYFYNADPSYKLAEVEAVGDVVCSLLDSVCCTNSLFIGKELSISELLGNEESCFEILKRDGNNLRFIDNQTDGICLAAVRQNGMALQYVNKQSEDICMAAISDNAMSLQFVKEQTPKVCTYAVRNNPYALQYVKEQTHMLCSLAVNTDGRSIYCVKDQTDDICMDAVRQCGGAVQYIRNLSWSICLTAAKKYGLSILHSVRERIPDMYDEIVRQCEKDNVFVI